ncbi:hypothetical protein HJG60_010076 [Phyllostomus discolor]|uniref:Uncharacterized protein n=1 Tax=Phyllostomus discolor TaxID=89673 RepID=A0A834EJY0_9CHIR|nr:hypothetical protein HJG60_010076 [Phyllostomus discolor]
MIVGWGGLYEIRKECDETLFYRMKYPMFAYMRCTARMVRIFSQVEEACNVNVCSASTWRTGPASPTHARAILVSPRSRQEPPPQSPFLCCPSTTTWSLHPVPRMSLSKWVLKQFTPSLPTFSL